METKEIDKRDGWNLELRINLVPSPWRRPTAYYGHCQLSSSNMKVVEEELHVVSGKDS